MSYKSCVEVKKVGGCQLELCSFLREVKGVGCLETKKFE